MQKWSIIHGNSLQELERLEPESIDGILTDPPYASGGTSASARKISPQKKYSGAKSPLPDFGGDQRDQRSWTYWMTLWMSLAFNACKVGAPIMVFTDWRQLPATTDALQAAGFIWRGVIGWNKPHARPQPGRPRQNLEFVVWGSKGAHRGKGSPLQGVVTANHVHKAHRRHLTEKPVKGCLDGLIPLIPEGGIVLDPFAGSAAVGEAALQDGRSYFGIEASPEYVEVGRSRLVELFPDMESTL